MSSQLLKKIRNRNLTRNRSVPKLNEPLNGPNPQDVIYMMEELKECKSKEDIEDVIYRCYIIHKKYYTIEYKSYSDDFHLKCCGYGFGTTETKCNVYIIVKLYEHKQPNITLHGNKHTDDILEENYLSKQRIYHPLELINQILLETDLCCKYFDCKKIKEKIKLLKKYYPKVTSKTINKFAKEFSNTFNQYLYKVYNLDKIDRTKYLYYKKKRNAYLESLKNKTNDNVKSMKNESNDYVKRLRTRNKK